MHRSVRNCHASQTIVPLIGFSYRKVKRYVETFGVFLRMPHVTHNGRENAMTTPRRHKQSKAKGQRHPAGWKEVCCRWLDQRAGRMRLGNSTHDNQQDDYLWVRTASYRSEYTHSACNRRFLADSCNRGNGTGRSSAVSSLSHIKALARVGRLRRTEC